MFQCHYHTSNCRSDHRLTHRFWVTYICQLTSTTLVLIMTYSLHNTKPLSDTMLFFVNWTLQNKFRCNLSKKQQFLYKKIDLKMSSMWWPLHINHHSYPVIPRNLCHACDATQRIPNYSIFWSMQQEWFWQTYCMSCLFDASQHDINTQYSWHVDRQCYKQKVMSYLYVV